MVLLYLPILSLFVLASASSEIARRDATGDSKCTSNMCIAAVLNGSTVQYTLTGTGKRTVGWLGMGFGTQMSNTPMVILWGNSDGTVTLSQRQAPAEIMPTVVANPPRTATLSTALSSTSGSSTFVFTIPANSGETKQPLIFAFGSANPGSSAQDAGLQQHLDYGVLQLDLSKSLTSSTTTASGGSPTSGTSTGGGNSSGPTNDIPLTPQQRLILAHAIFCVVGFALMLPVGVLVARYLRTFTPTWYTAHWIAQFGIAGPTIIAGVALGFKAAGKYGITIWDDHKKMGVVLFVLYLVQCAVGAFIHYVKAKKATGRPPQNYFHAVFGLTIIALGMYQIRTGYKEEWPNYTGLGSVPNSVNIVWTLWCVLLPVMYAAGLLFLRKQYRQEEASRKGWGSSSDEQINMNSRYQDI
ncbi:hypothetical protein B0H15DRAFT_837317 [Mycena belliarum]|uniref:CBD9-like protein n=1 Tax=Mycena belliarum TaxID=1033014 RepID=A0AAD6XQ37_9AGAR|nr:hypothetical protein B0H15DRAFT_837317 [Mycena belliae]